MEHKSVSITPKRFGYTGYMLGVLLVIQAFNYLDGLALGLVSQNIKHDLGLTDTQLGFLSGIAFWLFYSIMGIPIARWADKGNRVKIITVTVALWSIMVASCGFALTFLQLLAIRACVAVGEAGCIPPAHSLIGDYFSRGDRPRATSIYMLGGPMSTIVGYLLAGWLNQLYGWRTMFMMLGLPGLGLSAVAWLTLREPRLHQRAAVHSPKSLCEDGALRATSSLSGPGLKEVCITLWRSATFRHLLMCFAVMSFFVSGVLQWQPAFFVRSYGMHSGQLGTWFALIYGIGGVLGTYCCGWLVARFAASDERLQLRAMAIITCSFGIFSAFIYISPNRYVAFTLMALSAVTGAAINGPVFATIQTLVPDRMRATAIALIYLVANLIGTGLGPLAIGALSDAFRPWAGEESLRYALMILCPGYFWGGWHLWRAGKTVSVDLERLHGHEFEIPADPVTTSLSSSAL